MIVQLVLREDTVLKLVYLNLMDSAIQAIIVLMVLIQQLLLMEPQVMYAQQVVTVDSDPRNLPTVQLEHITQALENLQRQIVSHVQLVITVVVLTILLQLVNALLVTTASPVL